MGLFDFLKKDKKEKVNSGNDKYADSIKDKGDESKSEKRFSRLPFNKSRNDDMIDFSSIKKISPEEIKAAKEKRLQNDSRTDGDILKDETFRAIAETHSSRNNRIAAVMELKSQDVLEDLAMDNKDRYVRTIACSRITDPAILEELADNAKYTDVRQLAFDKLGKLDHVLCEIAKFDRKGKNRLDAVREIKDELVLMDISISAKDQKVRGIATEKIENNQILAHVLKNSSDKKIINMIINKENFNDQDVLSDICLDSSLDKFIRVEALNKIDYEGNKELLKEMAFNEENEHVKNAAIEKLNEEDDLTDLALNASDPSSRIKATGKISDENVLKEIAMNDDDKFVRIEAIRKIKIENIIKEIYLLEEDSFVRSDAIKQIESLPNLIDICLNDDDLIVAKNAINKLISNKDNYIDGGISLIDYENNLKEIANSSKHEDISRLAVKNIESEEILHRISEESSYLGSRLEAVGQMDSEEMLSDIAMANDDSNIRLNAIGKVKDKKILENVSVNGKFSDARIEAISKIRSQEILSELALNDNDSKIREAACKNILSSNLLARIAQSDDDKYVREIADKRAKLLKK